MKRAQIGLFTLISIGVGCIIGSGIFALPAVMAGVAGPGLILAILISGIISIFFALAYAELGAAFPVEGGPYAYPRLAMGDRVGFLMGWAFFIYLFVGTAAIINIFVVYLDFYIPGLAHEGSLTFTGTLVALAFLWIFTWINIHGIEWGGWYSIFTTIGKMIPLALFVFVGIFYSKASNFSSFAPFGSSGILLAVTLFFWAYTGFESIVVPADEIKDAKRNIPLAMILSILICIVVYLFISIVFVGMINWSNLGFSNFDWSKIETLSSPLSDVANSNSLKWLAAIATLGAVIATGGCGGSWVLIQGRMPYAMAKDNLFNHSLAKLHPKFGSPTRSLIFSSILSSIVLIALRQFASIAIVASVMVILPYASSMIAIPILRKKEPDVIRPFKIPYHFAFSLIGFILATILIYWASWPWTLLGAILFLTGYPAYYFVKGEKEKISKSLWIIVYLLGIVLISFLGDPKFGFINFMHISPLGIFKMPYDLIILSLFGAGIFLWVYFKNVRQGL